MLDLSTNEYFKALSKSIATSDIVKLFDNLLTIATEQEASDIHIEPYETFCRIRIRIDGIMHELIQYPNSIHENIIAKFKIESGQMRPDEKRIPQDARVSSITLTHKELDLRANTLPTVWGEKLVMRIVDKSKKIPLLEELGIEGSNMEILLRNLNYPNGIIITTGPTGSGKTSTLYACLNKLNKTQVNILTYEDPVESRINGLNQAQIRTDIGFSFASGLRGSLRQDPDIVLVGEIRDWETLDTAMEAAMTGHLVFSTLHTNSSAETITRTYNLGAKSYQLCGTFNLIMAQRLSRKICPHCQKDHSISDSDHYIYAKESLAQMDPKKLENELKLRNISQEQWKKFSDGNISVGTGKLPNGEVCTTCNGTGYKGRIGLFECMEYDDLLKDMLLHDKTAFEVEKALLENGMISLERDGIFKTIKGLTTLEEVYRLSKHK
jgi:type IV pilus assembly protein PilB